MNHPPLNPYAPPKTDEASAQTTAGDFDIGRAVNDAWEATKRYFPLWLGVGIVGTILMVLSAITIIGYFLVVPVLGWGMTKFLLNMQDGRADFNDLFSGFSQYGKALGRTLLLGLIYILMSVLAESVTFVGMFTKSDVLQAIGGFIYLVVAFGLIVRMYFAMFFIVDRDMGATDSLAASWQATQGKTWKLIGFAIVASVLAVSGLIGLCVGVVFTVMMSYVMYASAYRQMVGPPAGAAPTYPVPPGAPFGPPPGSPWGPPPGPPYGPPPGTPYR
jgi:hypothetical protein